MQESALAQKAQILLASDLFVSNTENCTLLEKRNILLVLGGLKPVGFVCSGHWKDLGEMGRESEADDPEFVGEFLASLGLCYSLFSDKYTTDATISLKQENIDALAANPGDHVLAGRLYGYPETAIAAFVSEGRVERLTEEEQEKVLLANGIPECFPTFWMSKAHYQDEIQVIKNWYAFCQLYGLA